MHKRYEDIVNCYRDVFGTAPAALFSAPGRSEILGNHTDHQLGEVLAAAIDRDSYAAAAPSGDSVIRLYANGYGMFEIDTADLTVHEDEKGTTAALIRGVAAGFAEHGYKIGGFRATLESDIFPGAGVSSSACYESLIVGILSSLYNDGHVSPLDMAKVGQFAERDYFGKPCGLLDQVGTSFGGIDFLDFRSVLDPVVLPMKFPFDLQIVLVNSGGSHAKLTPLYAQIPTDMFHIAKKYFGKEYLREVDPNDFFAHDWSKEDPKDARAIKRADHFFEENARVLKAKKAIQQKDLSLFLEAVRESGESSTKKLKNTMPPNRYPGSPQEAIDRARPFLKGGVARIMGGGFAGSIICFLPKKEGPAFIKKMASFYGEKNVVPVSIVDGGPALVE